MSIQKKLLFHLFVTVICVCGVGFAGYYSVKQTENAFAALFEGQTLPLLALDGLERTAEKMFLLMVLHNDAQDLETMEQHETSISQMQERLQSQLDEYRGLIERFDSPKAMDVEEFSRCWEDFMQNVQQVLSLSRSFEKEFAYNSIIYEGRPAFEILLNLLTEQMMFHREQMSILRRDVRTIRQDAERTIGGGVLLCIAIVILWGWQIRRNITRLLLRNVEVAARLAQGEITQTFSMKHHGELGQLLQAMKLMSHRIQQVLEEMSELIGAVRKGRLDVRGDSDKFQGSWHELVSGFNSVIEAFVTPITALGNAIDSISRGDIRHTLDEEYDGEFEMIKQKLNSMVSSLNAIMTEVRSAAGAVVANNRQVRSGSVRLAEAVNEQASISEEVSASMEQMLMAIRRNTRNAAQTEKIAARSAQNARESCSVVRETMNAMQQIAKTISIVEELSSQTHLLSLNATIEAAKAQEYGKGFAVVASEVRALAQRSREAAEEIGKLAGSGVELAEDAGERLARLVPEIEETSALVQEISGSTHEQNVNVGQVNQAMQHLNQVIQENASASEEISTTLEELSRQAEQLQQTIGFFKLRDSNGDESASTFATDLKIVQAIPDPKAVERPRKSDYAVGGRIPAISVSGSEDVLDREFERY